LNSKIIKKIRKITIWSLISILSLIIISIILLSIPYIQTLIAKKAASYFSKELNTEISIDRVKISLKLDVYFENLKICDQRHNSMIEVEKLSADIGNIYFFNKIILINSIDLKNPKINIKKYETDSVFNIKFLIDYFSPKTKSNNKKWSFKANSFLLNNVCINFDNNHKDKALTQGFIDFNHLKLSNFNLKIENINIKGDTILARINHLSIFDSSGFYLKDFSCNFKFQPQQIYFNDLKIKTLKSNIHTDLKLKYKSTEDFKDFIHKVIIEADIYRSHFQTSDLCFISKNIRAFDNSLTFVARINGSISNLSIKNLKLVSGNSTFLDGDFIIKGLPNISKTYFDANIHKLSTTLKDVENIRLPNNNLLKIPQIFSKFGIINLFASFNGFYDNFNANATFESKVGNLNFDLKVENKDDNITYIGNVAADNFKISEIDSTIGIIETTFQANIFGSGIKSNTLNINIKSNIDYINYKGYRITNSILNGNYSQKIFSGRLLIDDSKIFIDAKGTFNNSNSVPIYQFDAKIKNAQLTNLNLIKSDKNILLSTNIIANFKGEKIDDFQGTLLINNTEYYENGNKYYLDNLKILSLSDSIGMRLLSINSDWVDATFKGKFLFYEIKNTLNRFIANYLPAFSTGSSLISSNFLSKNIKQKAKNEFDIFSVSRNDNRKIDFDINIKESNPIALLINSKFIAKGKTKINGFIDIINKNIDLNVSSDTLTFGKNTLNKLKITAHSVDSTLEIKILSENFIVSEKDKINFENIKLLSTLNNGNIYYTLSWNNTSDTTINNNGIIKGDIQFSKNPILNTIINEGVIIVNDSIWFVEKGNRITIDTGFIEIENLSFRSNSKQIYLNGQFSKDPKKTMNIKLVNFNVSDIDPLTKNRSIDFDGLLSGNIEISNVYNKASLIANLKIIDFGFNGQKIGIANIVSAWDERKKGLFLNTEVTYKGNFGEAQPLLMQGYFYPNDGTIDFNADVLNFKLKVIEKYINKVFNNVDGLVTGKFKLTGKLSSPELSGKAKLIRCKLGVGYLNTSYSINQEITVKKDRFEFDSVFLIDKNNNIGILSGYISHKYFKDFYLNLKVNANNLWVLNTDKTINNHFYGKSFVTGAVHVYGAVPDIQIDAQVETEKNSEIFIPISYTTTVNKSSFINFINIADIGPTKSKLNKPIYTGINLNFLINVNNLAKFHIFLDPSTGGSLHGSGNGNIRMTVNSNGDFNMFGTYIVSEGDYEMKLKDLIQKRFKIEDGGTIIWNGNPTDANINIKAIYPVKASLNTLFAVDSTNKTNTNRKVNVNSTLFITGNLLNPNIKFGLELPNCDNNTRATLFNLIDTTNDQSMIRQTFSLLVLGRFEPETNQYGNIVGEGVGLSSTELITNQLNNWIAQSSISDLVNIGVNYKMADQVTTDEYQVILSKELFNERLSINGNVGYGGQNKNLQNTSSVIGEVTIEWKITPDGRYSLKAYNLSNANQYTNQNIPYIQGGGFVYRVSYNKLSDLFKKKEKPKIIEK